MLLVVREQSMARSSLRVRVQVQVQVQVQVERDGLLSLEGRD